MALRTVTGNVNATADELKPGDKFRYPAGLIVYEVIECPHTDNPRVVRIVHVSTEQQERITLEIFRYWYWPVFIFPRRKHE